MKWDPGVSSSLCCLVPEWGRTLDWALTSGFLESFGGSQGNLCIGSPLIRFADILKWPGVAGVGQGRLASLTHFPSSLRVTRTSRPPTMNAVA